VRQVLSLILTFAILSRSAPASPDTPGVTAQIMAMSLGANIELRLKNNEKLRGARGAVSGAGFTLVTPAGDRPIAFDEVASVKLYVHKSHTTRNILIGVGIGLAAVAIWLGIELRCGPFGCGKRTI
jgi:hypothetical protein